MVQQEKTVVANFPHAPFTNSLYMTIGSVMFLIALYPRLSPLPPATPSLSPSLSVTLLPFTVDAHLSVCVYRSGRKQR